MGCRYGLGRHGRDGTSAELGRVVGTEWHGLASEGLSRVVEKGRDGEGRLDVAPGRLGQSCGIADPDRTGD